MLPIHKGNQLPAKYVLRDDDDDNDDDDDDYADDDFPMHRVTIGSLTIRCNTYAIHEESSLWFGISNQIWIFWTALGSRELFWRVSGFQSAEIERTKPDSLMPKFGTIKVFCLKLLDHWTSISAGHQKSGLDLLYGIHVSTEALLFRFHTTIYGRDLERCLQLRTVTFSPNRTA